MHDAFFYLNFLNVRGTLAQKIYNTHAIFRQCCDVIKGDDPNNQSYSISWLPMNSKALELVVQRKAYLIFQ